jgi:hypothetical protein
MPLFVKRFVMTSDIKVFNARSYTSCDLTRHEYIRISGVHGFKNRSCQGRDFRIYCTQKVGLLKYAAHSFLH